MLHVAVVPHHGQRRCAVADAEAAHGEHAHWVLDLRQLRVGERCCWRVMALGHKACDSIMTSHWAASTGAPAAAPAAAAAAAAAAAHLHPDVFDAHKQEAQDKHDRYAVGGKGRA